MVRGKVVLKKIEKASSKQVTFSKRRMGLFKKAEELAILCDAEVAAIVCSDNKIFYEFSSKRMDRILARYNDVPESSEQRTSEDDQPQPGVEALKFEFAMLRRMHTRLIMGKRYKGLSSDEWEPFKHLLNEVLSAVKEQKKEDAMEKFEKARLKVESGTAENQALREQIEELKRNLAVKKDQLNDPENSLGSGLVGETSQKVITAEVENDVEDPMQIE